MSGGAVMSDSMRFCRPAGIGVLLGTVLAGSPSVVSAEVPPVSPSATRAALSAGRAAVDAYDYRGADRALRQVRDRLEALTPEEAVEALTLSAVVSLSLDQYEQAESMLLALLLRSPSFRPPEGGWPPAWTAVFDAARRRVPDRYAPTLTVDAPTVAPIGRPIRIRVKAVDPSGVRTVQLSLAEPTLRLDMTPIDATTYVVDIPAEHVVSPRVRFWVEAYDQYGNGPGYFAPPRRPTSIRIDSPLVAVDAPDSSAAPAESIFESWWFWTLTGALVVGAGVSTAVLVSQANRPATVEARLSFP